MRIAIITGASSGLGTEFTKTIIEKYSELDEIWMIARCKERLEHRGQARQSKQINTSPKNFIKGDFYDYLLFCNRKQQICSRKNCSRNK